MLFALATSHKIGLAAMGSAFIIFALISSFVLPRMNPNFPGRGLRWYLVVCVAFFVAMLSTILTLAKEKKTAEAAGAAEPAQSTPSTAAPKGDAAAGKVVFNGAAGCGGCHTFAPAAAKGTVGPDLDKLADYATKAGVPLDTFTRESIEEPAKYVEQGYAAGVMPGDYSTSLSVKQIDDLVAFLDAG